MQVPAKIRAGLTVALVCLVGVAAHAEEAVAPDLLACSKLGRNAERLACYDAAIQRRLTPASAAATGKPVVDAATVARTPQDSFGAVAPRKPSVPSEGAPVRTELQSVSAAITKMTPTSDGFLQLALDNGQVWRQIEGSSSLLLKTGDTVSISRGALGSFMLATPTGRRVKVKRVS